MAIPSSTALTALRAIGEATRLRIVALLREGELTVSDLTDILGQSQPRISRHLKLLVDAGLVDKHREGTWAYFRLVPDTPVGAFVTDVTAHLDDHDPTVAADRDRLAVVRARRSAAAQEFFATIADRWDEERSLHASDEAVEAAIAEVARSEPYRSLLDLGTGTGRMLQLLAHDRLDRAVGLDNSHSMLAIARDHLERAELRHVELRQGDVYSPPLTPDTFDLIVVHQVLHFLDDPARAARETMRLLAPGGRLLVVDLAAHSLDLLRIEHGHRRLGFHDETVAGWFDAGGLDLDEVRHVVPDADDGLTVSLWVGRDRRRATTTEHHIEHALTSEGRTA